MQAYWVVFTIGSLTLKINCTSYDLVYNDSKLDQMKGLV